MDALLEPFSRLLDDIESEPAEAQVHAIENAGFFEVLVPEANGGAGLRLADVQPLIAALGYYAIKAPITERMAARGLGSDALPPPLIAVLAAAEIAGATARVFEMALTHARDRNQFGKPIAAQQAVQHNLAIMAEQVVMARMAGQMGCLDGLDPRLESAATAKYVSSIAALQVATLGHAIHGAIGITQEHALHRFTARLHALRLAGGGESWWAEQLGRRALGSSSQDALELVRGWSG